MTNWKKIQCSIGNTSSLVDFPASHVSFLKKVTLLLTFLEEGGGKKNTTTIESNTPNGRLVGSFRTFKASLWSSSTLQYVKGPRGGDSPVEISVKGKMVGWAPWDGGPLIINPIYTLYSGHSLGISPFKGLLGGLNS